MSNYIMIALLALTDLISFYVSLFLAVVLRKNSNLILQDLPEFQFEISDFIGIWWLPVVFIFLTFYEKMYVKRVPVSQEVKISLKVISLLFIFAMTIISLGKMQDSISRLTLIYFTIIIAILFPLLRLIVKMLVFTSGFATQKVLLIGENSISESIEKSISNQKILGFRIISSIPEKVVKKMDKKRLNEITKDEINKNKIDTIIITLPHWSGQQLSSLVAQLQMLVRRVLIAPDLSGVAILNSELYPIFSDQTFLIKVSNNLQSSVSKLIKLFFDYSIIIISIPILLIIALCLIILIKIESKGPVLFSHKRVGKNGKVISVLKFRTMYQDAEQRLETLLKNSRKIKKEWDKNFKLKDDPRVTRIGGFLRKTSLDELPQLINVLKGEMSLIGPRPVLEKELVEYYGEYRKFYEFVRPGLSGLWQVSGRSELDYDKRVKLDTWYVLNWSVWLDFTILMKTFLVVIKREGAY